MRENPDNRKVDAGEIRECTDEKKIQILKSGCTATIEQVTDWGAWATTDVRKTHILRSRCNLAIQQIQQVLGWDVWANTDERRTLVLESGSRAVIGKVISWGVWV